MPLIDLSHSFSPTISVYPGSVAPIFKQLAIVSKNGYAEKQITFQSHHGTHMDATAHMVANGKTLDELTISHFIGKAITIDIQSFSEQKVPVAFFLPFTELLLEAAFVLLHTGWSKYWKQKEYENNFPVLEKAATAFLCQHKNLKGIGMDSFSPDPVGSPDYANHHIAFSNDVLLIENLTNLDKLPHGELINFQCFPMKIEGADGAPVRAVASFSSTKNEQGKRQK